MRTLLLALASALSITVTAAPLAVPPPPDLAAKAYLLLDFQSGAHLAARDPDKRIDPASLTKLMTEYLTLKAVKEGRLRLDQQLTVSQKGWKTEGSRMFLDPKKPARVDELLRGMIVQSGNDACVTLAEAIAGSEENFAGMMNQQAAALGMTGTHFMNSTGLPNPQHYTTARDLSVLAMAIMRDYPEFFAIASMKEYRYNNITQPNRNLLLFRDPEVDGLKTGHTDSAGYCLIATKHHDGRRVLSVVLGTASENARADESAKLLGYGLNFFDTTRLYAAKQAVAQTVVYKGEANQVAAGFDRDQFITVPKGAIPRIQAQTILQPKLIAPLAAGQVIGSVKLTLDGQPLAELPLKTLAAVPQAGFFGRMVDSVKLWWK
ncbi:D-alanyl-D-alanine carboxypeptidase family protein [Chitinimonas sp.]|uniref:D-alanyl-D-alanine carboxypeptidase family protein n=1 Tax=Chitinimonas sp. TaxID=1934313 RepID=UPI0035AE5DAE